MRLVEVNVKEEYQKSYGEREDEEILDFIFSHRLLPWRVYYPAEALAIGDPLFMLPDSVEKVSYFRKRGNFSLREIFESFFGSDVLIKNEDEILEEKGELIMTEDSPSGDAKVDQILSNLYPGEKCAHMALDTLKMRGKTYQILVQVGFVRKGRMRIEDTLPPIHNIILKEEKPVIYPLLEDIFKKILFQAHCFCLN